MPITVSTCITNTGTQPLSATLEIYSNPVSLYNQGTFVQNVPSASITGANCPYTFTVPNGTINVRILDPTTLCYVDLPVSGTNVCTTCSLGLNNVNNNLLGQINVGVLTGSCDNSISDYIINWYGPDSTSNLAFTSGQGTAFTGQYQYSHPITSTNSPVLNPGTYVGKITKVDLNGAKLSSTGGTGNILSPTLPNCPTNINVTTYDCTNGGSYGTYYNHFRNFNYNGSVAPSVLTTKLKLNGPNKKYVVFAFQGQSIYDTIKFTLSGSAYQTPIQLEECTVGGSGVSNNFTPTTWPKTVNSDLFFKKILNLNNLTINDNDIIDIKITPNSGTPETNWTLYFGCSTQPTGSKTCLDSYKDTPYKIKQSTIPTNVTPSTSCPPTYSVSFSISGCPSSANTIWTNSSLYNLVNTKTSGTYSTNNINNLLNLTFNDIRNSYNNISNTYGFYYSSVCQPTVGENMLFQRNPNNSNVYKFYFKNINDVYTITNSFNLAKTTATNYPSAIYTTNPSSINYYRQIYFLINKNSICGDGQQSDVYIIPVNSTIVSGATSVSGYTYEVILTPPLQTYSNAACLAGYCNCDNLLSNTTTINQYTTGTTVSYVTNKIYTNAFYYGTYYRANLEPSQTSRSTEGKLTIEYPYGDLTYPSSGGTNYNNTLLTSLSATTWDWNNHFNITSTEFSQRLYYYTVIAKTPLTNPLGFEIWGYTISNFGLGTNYKIYDSVTGVVPGRESFFV